MKKYLEIFLIFLCITAILATGCTNTSSTSAVPLSPISGDQASIDKMKEMSTWITPTMGAITDSLVNKDFSMAGINGAQMRSYIDKNLPEMNQLANNATTKKAASLEFVAYLEDLRSASDKLVQVADKYNSGNFTDLSALLKSSTQDLNSAAAHISRAKALI